MNRRSEQPEEHPCAPIAIAESGAGADFRSSLLLVLTGDLVILLCWLAWSRRSSAAAGLALVAVIVPLLVVLATRPTLRRVVTMLARSETNRRYVIVPIAACVVFASLALELGNRAQRLVTASAARHLGPIDELIVSPTADARNQALDALTRARVNDVRMSSSVDDLLPSVIVDGSLQIGERDLAVTVMELDVAAAEGFGGVASETGLIGEAPLGVGDVGIDRALVDASAPAAATKLSIGGVARDVRVLPIGRGTGFASADLLGLGDPSFGRPAEQPVVFVAPGTISIAVDALADLGRSANARFVVLVSNQGGAVSGLRRSSANVTLLEELLANPSIGPVALPADDPLGLGGSTVSVAAPIDATVIAVKAAHAERLRALLDESALSRRLARAALYTAAVACGVLVFVVRRRRHVVQRGVLRSLGLGNRPSLAVEWAFLGFTTLIGLIAGVLSTVFVRAVIGSYLPMDRSFLGDADTVAQAITLAGGLAFAPLLFGPVGRIFPMPVRRLVQRVAGTRVPSALVVVSGVVLAVGSVLLLRRRSTVWTSAAGFVALIVGVGVALGATVLPRPPFGRRTSARPIRRLRARSFAVVAAATGLVVLPVAASQSLSASAVAESPWRSVALLSDETDAAGLAGQLVRSVGGRVLHVSTILVEGGGIDAPGSPSVALAAADGYGDNWSPRRHAPVGASVSADLPAGSVVVSQRLADIRGATLRAGDRLVLRDPETTRSVTVVVHDVVVFPHWAGDLALSGEVFMSLLTPQRVSASRRAIAISPMERSVAARTLTALAPNSTASVRDIGDGPPTLNAALVGWLRRAALVTLFIGLLLAMVLRTHAWRPIHWTVVVAAVVFGWLAGATVGGPPTLSPVGPLAVAVALALLCCVCALRVLTPDLRIRDVMRYLPSRPKRTGEFD